MTKVEIVSNESETALQNYINAFIKDKILVDIKYDTCSYGAYICFSAMIIYEA